MVRAPFVDKDGLKRGAWSEEEEEDKLKAYVLKYGHSNWKLLPKFAGLARCGKSCRLRWFNYLKPGIKRGDFNEQEVHELIKKLHDEHGNKWSTIAAQLPGRTDNEIKNYWHTHYDKPNKSTGRLSSSKAKKIERDCCFASSSRIARSQSEPKSDQVMYFLESSSPISDQSSVRSTRSSSDTNVNSSDEGNISNHRARAPTIGPADFPR